MGISKIFGISAVGWALVAASAQSLLWPLKASAEQILFAQESEVEAPVQAGCFRERFVQVAGIRNDFRVSVAEIDAASITASVDGSEAPYNYNSADNEIHLLDAGRNLSRIEIHYCLRRACSGFDCGSGGI